MKKFINYIKDKRTTKGLSTYKLAALVGVSQSYLSQLENGRKDKPPSPEIIKKLSNALEVDYFELMRLAGYMDTIDFRTDFTGFDALPPKRAPEYNQQKVDIVYDPRPSYRKDPIGLLLNGSFPKEKLFKSIRSVKKISIDEISKRSGLEAQFVQDFEDAKNYPTEQHLYSLFHALHLEDLYSWLTDHLDALVKDLDQLDRIKIKKHLDQFLKANFTEVSFKVFNREEFTDSTGQKVTRTVPKEELTERFFSLNHLLEREGNVYYEGKILSKKDRDKIKILLNLMLED
ncbi:helix-turn-helix domain-containing protein [Domibacillus sp. PGB-M46]|uniref:helix-turn-helix domain-containing protein n=1 Tax=Domibacillus sp. PGB-M46 TaxID=2910255 RepID=UPI001F5A8639|nr:helix-turn-helix domain-containing protein [Domibacillus sp. PGB-M46]MCI2255537.1 helix-turn-helix domain-containing protein [Domibacillus sp. PGB-M46]